MGMTIDDNVKQKLLDSLAEEPTMVLSTAYAYAKSYVEYGEDITKLWTTAVQQTSIIAQVRQKAWGEAYDSFKKEYENRLKADMVAMLIDLQLKIKEAYCEVENDYDHGRNYGLFMTTEIIQQKINAMRKINHE